MQRVPMTIKGKEALEQELNQLKTVARRDVIQAIAEARAHGDLKENAEYHAAKEKQSFIEGRISEIESKLATAQVIDIKEIPYTGRVIFGSTVTLFNLDSQTEVTYQIVGEDEADVKANKISVSSPIARAIIGKEEGEEVEVSTPAGFAEYEISRVEYK